MRFNKKTINIAEIIQIASDCLGAQDDVVFAYLFGSLAKGDQTPLSDIDIAVYLNPETDFSQAKLEIMGVLIDGLQTDDIDLVVLNTASLPVQIRVLQNNTLLIDNKPFTRHAYESLTIRKYIDFSYIENAILERRYSIG